MFKLTRHGRCIKMGAGAPFPVCANEESASGGPVLTYISSSIIAYEPKIINFEVNPSSRQERVYSSLIPASATSGVHKHAASSAVNYNPSVVSISGTMRGSRASSGGYLGRQVLVDVGQQGRGCSYLPPAAHSWLPGIQPKLLVKAVRPLQAAHAVSA